MNWAAQQGAWSVIHMGMQSCQSSRGKCGAWFSTSNSSLFFSFCKNFIWSVKNVDYNFKHSCRNFIWSVQNVYAMHCCTLPWDLAQCSAKKCTMSAFYHNTLQHSHRLCCSVNGTNRKQWFSVCPCGERRFTVQPIISPFRRSYYHLSDQWRY